MSCAACASYPFSFEARKILSTMQSATDAAVEKELLDERVTLCEHLFQLAVGDLTSQMEFAELKAHVGQTVQYVARYPRVIQIQVTGRYVTEKLGEVVACFGKGGDRQQLADQFTSYFKWDHESLQGEPDDFVVDLQGDNPKWDSTLGQLQGAAAALEETAFLTLDTVDVEAEADDSEVAEEKRKIKVAELRSVAQDVLLFSRPSE